MAQDKKPKRGRGRPKGKHSNPDYRKLTLYIRNETIIEVKRRLLDQDESASDLVQQLLDDWLASNPEERE